MSVGERIKFHRKRRGMTQRELGTEVGFPPASADVRIAQYESGSRCPKEPLCNALAAALGISPAALTVPDLDDPAVLLRILFALEDQHKLDLSFDGATMHVRVVISAKKDSPLYTKLYFWMVMRRRLTDGEIAQEEYYDWRYDY